MFDQAAFDEYDRRCRDLAIEKLPALLEKYEPGQYDNLILYDNPDQYGIDLLGMSDTSGPVHVEVECKATDTWNSPWYGHMDILYRKKKFIGPVPTLFVAISWDWKRFAVVKGATLEKLEPKKKWVTSRQQMEDFYFVPPGDYKNYYVGEPTYELVK